MALNLISSFNPNLRTTIPREGVDIGPAPDFWSDLNRLQSRLRPAARNQMAAFAPHAPMLESAPRERGGGGGGADYTPLFGVATNIGGGATFYQPWRPGMPLGFGQKPVYMGYLPAGYESQVPRLPQAAYFA